MTTLRDWGPSDDRALDRWITRGDHDDDPPEGDDDGLLPDCHEGAEIGPGARPCGACAECLGLVEVVAPGAATGPESAG
jgi:hypothetical protein